MPPRPPTISLNLQKILKVIILVIVLPTLGWTFNRYADRVDKNSDDIKQLPAAVTREVREERRKEMDSLRRELCEKIDELKAQETRSSARIEAQISDSNKAIGDLTKYLMNNPPRN